MKHSFIALMAAVLSVPALSHAGAPMADDYVSPWDDLKPGQIYTSANRDEMLEMVNEAVNSCAPKNQYVLPNLEAFKLVGVHVHHVMAVGYSGGVTELALYFSENVAYSFICTHQPALSKQETESHEVKSVPASPHVCREISRPARGAAVQSAK